MIRIITNEETTMAHYPNGQLKFLTIWQTYKLLWWAVWNKVPIVIEDARAKK